MNYLDKTTIVDTILYFSLYQRQDQQHQNVFSLKKHQNVFKKIKKILSPLLSCIPPSYLYICSPLSYLILSVSLLSRLLFYLLFSPSFSFLPKPINPHLWRRKRRRLVLCRIKPSPSPTTHFNPPCFHFPLFASDIGNFVLTLI
jgi:hypothetical protein